MEVKSKLTGIENILSRRGYARFMTTSRVPNLRKLRTERLLSQSQLAEALGLSSRTVLRWENGDGEPSVTEVLALARFFHVGIDQLISDLVPEAPQAGVKVSDLSGEMLDYWVAKVQGMPVELTPDGPVLYEPRHGHRAVPAFSRDANLAEPLIHRKGMLLQSLRAGALFDGVPTPVDGWIARCFAEPVAYWGSCFPEAAMRAYLASMTGQFVIA